MTERKTLPNRRACHLVDFEHGTFRYTAAIGRFADGNPAEVFLNADKAGTPIDAAGRDAAILLSLALQHGCPAETMRHAITRDRNGAPSSPIGAVLDMLAAGEGQR